jgi:ADP-ribose pyrophosphatase YjhB (NUDIX family)
VQLDAIIKPIAVVNGVIFNPQREVLLTRRSKLVREPGKWCLPGGHLEIGERFDIAMAREIHEEVGLKVKAQKLLGLYSDPALTVTSTKLPEGYYAQFLCATFLITEFENEVAPNEEVDDWDWFELGNLPEPMMKSHPIRVADAYRFTGEVFLR